MKNFLFIVCSVLAFTITTFSCTEKQKPANVEADTVKQHVVIAVNVADTIKALEAQNFVADTSYTSVQSSLVSAQSLANAIDENVYKASLVNDRITDKIRKLEKLEARLDNAISARKNLSPLLYSTTQYSVKNDIDTSFTVGYKLSSQLGWHRRK